jgi:hypothetical protein
MKNVVKKLNWVLPNVTSKIQTKSIQPIVCALNNCFCHQKAEMNFTQSNFKNMDNFKLIFSSYSTVFARTVTRFDILHQLLPYFQNFQNFAFASDYSKLKRPIVSFAHPFLMTFMFILNFFTCLQIFLLLLFTFFIHFI